MASSSTCFPAASSLSLRSEIFGCSLSRPMLHHHIGMPLSKSLRPEIRSSLDTKVSDMAVNAPKGLFPPEPEHYRGPKLKVAIIGAGLAGMSTAVELLDQGHEVDIYDSRSFIGGKVGSFVDKRGNHVEMGLHVFFGCYSNLFRLMKKVGADENLLVKDHTHTFINKGGQVGELDFRFPVGAPLHGISAFLTTNQLKTYDKARNAVALALSPVVRALIDPNGAMRDIRDLDSISFSDWFLSKGGTRTSIQRMWDPVAYALGFIDCDNISARCMLTIFTLFATKTEASLLRMLKGSPDVYLSGPIRKYIEEKGGRFHLRWGCREILYDKSVDGETYVKGIAMSKATSKKIVKADVYVAACDVPGIKRLLPFSIFASKNLDFRNRAFLWLFSDCEGAELNATEVESHMFPQHFIEMSRKVGLAPAAIVSTCGELDASALKSVDLNRLPATKSPAISAGKFSIEDDVLCQTVQRLKPNTLKENDNYDNPYATIAMARDSLKHREATKRAEMQELEDELNEMKHENEAQRLQDLESVLVKRKRRVEKCRRLAEAQSSYRDLLEKMIRDSMHQTVVYKEQIRLNRAANSALMSRLEAQRAICYSSEKELHRKFKQRDELENQIRPYWEHVRKRSRMDDTLSEEKCDKTMQLLPGRGTRKPLRKELRLLLEEQKAFEARVSLAEEKKQEEEEKQRDRHLIIADNITAPDDKLLKLSIREEDWRKTKAEKKIRSVPQSPQKEDDEDGQCRKAFQKMKVRSVPQSPQSDDEEYRKRIGKVNVDKWLQMLLEDNQDSPLPDSPQNIGDLVTGTNEIVKKPSLRNTQPGTSDFRCVNQRDEEREYEKGRKKSELRITNEVGSAYKGVASSKSFEGKGMREGACEM